MMIKRTFEAVTIEDMLQFKDELMSQFATNSKYEKVLEILNLENKKALQNEGTAKRIQKKGKVLDSLFPFSL